MQSRALVLFIFTSLAPRASAAADQVLIEVPGGRITLSVTGGAPKIGLAAIETWVAESARAVAAYYGRFPVDRAQVNVRIEDGDEISGGMAFPNRSVRVDVGREVEIDRLMNDWRMTHELVHLAFPSVHERHHWIEEGLASYVEPMARAQIGALEAERVWGELIEGLPRGQPEEGDRGLDHTHTWGRTYWGGALFCFVAEIEIRERTRNQKGLRDALRAIVREGGTIDRDWELSKALEIGDREIGVPVLRPLYDRMKAQPVEVDLATMWRRLGIEAAQRDGRLRVRFDDRAPLAATRRAIAGE
jgi:hypothetical protein